MEYNSGNIRDPFLFLGTAASSGLDLLKNTGRLSNTEGSEKYGPKPYFVMRRNKMRVRSEKSTGRAFYSYA